MNIRDQKAFSINEIEFSNAKNFVLIAGPCVIESKDHAYDMAGRIKEICTQLKLNFIFFVSYIK